MFRYTPWERMGNGVVTLSVLKLGVQWKPYRLGHNSVDRRLGWSHSRFAHSEEGMNVFRPVWKWDTAPTVQSGCQSRSFIYRCQRNGICPVVCVTLSQKGYLLGRYAASGSDDSLPTFGDEPIGSASKGQGSGRNCHYSLCNCTEERSSRLLLGGSLESDRKRGSGTPAGHLYPSALPRFGQETRLVSASGSNSEEQ